ncbi:VPS2.3 [Scenedesmus sp. PABB004]|nr:VPS2.3 [Scenedesmus sp. PABB004]
MKLFKKPDVKEVVKSSQQQIKRGVRDLDKEVLALRREEEKLVREIKAAAKSNPNSPATRVLAKSLVRLRAQIAKLQGSSANLRGVSTNITTAAAATTVSASVATATKAMGAIQLDPAKVAATVKQFARETARMDMTQEMVGDTLDDALDGEGVDEETGELVSQVLDEIGVDVSASLGSAPQRRVAARQPAAAAAAPDDAELGDLAARLAMLRG